jgi:hypothetical protein
VGFCSVPQVGMVPYYLVDRITDLPRTSQNSVLKLSEKGF